MHPRFHICKELVDLIQLHGAKGDMDLRHAAVELFQLVLPLRAFSFHEATER